jgi:transcriptional regulator with XRE-family HTH domain
LAARLGVTKQYLSDVEHDRRRVSVERAAAWADALGYHAGQFVELAVQGQTARGGVAVRRDVSGRRGGRAA